MPLLAVGGRRILVGVDLHQRRLALFVRRVRMDVQLAEQPAEAEMLGRREVLVAEEDDQVLRQRAVQLVHRPVGQRLGEIDAADLRTDDGRELVHRHGFIGLRRRGGAGDSGDLD